MRHDPTSITTVDNGCTFPTVTGVGRWEASDCDGEIVDIRWFGAADDEIDDTAAIAAAAGHLQSAGGGTLTGGSGKFLVSTNGAVAVFTNLSGINIDVRGSFVTTDLGDSSFTSVALTNSGATATATWAAPHGLAVGRYFAIKNSADDAYNGIWVVSASNSPTVLTFALSSYGMPSGPATAIAHDSDIGRCLFRFDGCTNVDVGNLTFRGVEHPRDIQYRLGYRVIETRFGTTKIRGDLRVSGASYGWYSGEYAVESWGNCTDFKVRTWANSVGYPVAGYGSGHDSEFDIYAENVHRGGYFGGVKRSTARVWMKNFDVAGAILTTTGGVDQWGCEDFKLRLYDTGTTEPIDLLGVGGTRYLAIVNAYYSTNEVRHRNLDIQVHGRNIIQTSGLLVQTLSSNHWIDGLTFGGSLDQSGIASTNSRWPVFVYATNPSETAGQFRDLVFRDWKFIAPSDADGSISAWVVLANPINDVVFDGEPSYGMGPVVGLADGFHANIVPRFPDWTHGSYEAAQIQRVEGGMDLSATKTIVPMVGHLGSNDFTIQWVGEIPSGNAGLFAITTGSSATAGSFGASITNGNLIVRAYGASAADWVGVTATNWAPGLRGKVSSLGIVRTAIGVSLWTDGHSTAGIATTSGTPPAWSDALSGTNAVIGIEDSTSEYWGTVYRFAVWNYAREDEFPDLAIRWGAGESAGGRNGYTLDGSTGNGGFETLGAGGADVFASWDELALGGSSIGVSTNAVEGTNSLSMVVDGSASFSGVMASETMVPGVTYEIVFWSRIVGGTSGQIAFVGAAGGDYPVSIGGSWARQAVRLLWNSSTFSFKRWSLTGQTAEIDAMSIRRIGALCDLDWTGSPADRVTGVFPSPLGGAANRIIARGLGISADRGNNSANLESGQDAPIQIWASALTGAKTVSIQTNHAKRGDVFRIVRTTGDTNTLTVVGRNVATDQWLDVAFDGLAWVPVGYGYVTNSYATITGLGPLATGDAPTNGLMHGRLDGVWTAIASNHVAGLSNWMALKADTNHTQSYTTITGLGSLATVNDAASDGNYYARRNAAWSALASMANVSDAASDGTTYGRQNGAWAPVSGGLSDAPSNGSPHGREDGAWVVVAEAAHTHAYLPLAATTNSPLTGDLLLKKTLPSLFFSDDSSSLGGGVAFGVGGFVIGPVAYGNPDYIGTPWIEISTNGALTVLDDVLSSGDGTFSGTVSGTMLEGERLELDTASNTNAPAAGKVAIFLRQVGGDGQLVARFPTGADHVLAPAPAPASTTLSTVLGNTDAVTVPDTEAAETTLIGTIRSGESATFGAGTIATGAIIKVEAMGTVTAAGNWADGVLRVKFGSSRALAFTVLEEDSHVATDYAWRLTAYLSVTTAGATATTVLSGMMEYEYPNDADTPGVRRLRHLSGTASGTLDTTGANVFDITWDNATGLEVDWTCNHLLVTRY
jgi:hypothetical protein